MSKRYPGMYRTISHQATLRAGVRPDALVDLQFSLPFYYFRNRARDLENFNLVGQGDTSLLSDWFPWRALETAPGDDVVSGLLSLRGLSFRGGFKLPTGRAEKDLDISRGPATLLQLGSGTLDAVLGVQFTGHLGGFTLFHRTEVRVALMQNAHGFRPGEQVSTATGGGYTAWHRLTAALTVSTLHFGKDRVDGRAHPMTGSHFWFVTPSVSVRLVDQLSLYASMRVRIISRTRYPGTGELFSVGASWFVAF